MKIRPLVANCSMRTDGQTDGRTDGQTYRHTGRQADIQTGRQTWRSKSPLFAILQTRLKRIVNCFIPYILNNP
jgi:hypothetical protein